jgi:hypothetical protein
MAAFAGVRVEAAHRDARRGDAEAAAQLRVDDRERLAHGVARDRGGHVGQREVRRDQRDAQRRLVVAADEHHDHARRAGALGEELGVAGEREARVEDRALLHGPVTSAAKAPSAHASQARRSIATTLAPLVGSGCPGTGGATNGWCHTSTTPPDGAYDAGS